MAKEIPTEELAELWECDSQGEYVQINPNGKPVYCEFGAWREDIPTTYSATVFSRDGERTVQREYKTVFHAIRAWMKAKQFWPNVWEVNDHGNVSLYTSKGKYLGGLV